MSKLVSGLLGATALLLSVGAAQFAVGQSLSANTVHIAAATSASMVNRAVKADQATSVARAGGYSTVVTALDDTTIAMRSLQSRGNSQDARINSRPSKRPVACEASASVLTEVAKLMESARCVT